MDAFKNYLQQHRDEPVSDAPSQALLDRIHRGADRRMLPLVAKWIIAAGILLPLAGTALYFFYMANKTPVLSRIVPAPRSRQTPVAAIPPTTPVATDRQPVGNSPVPPPARRKREKQTTRRLENSYVSLVRNQLDKVERKPIYNGNAGYFRVFRQQWNDTKADERHLLRDIQAYGFREEMVEQKVAIYRVRLDLLQRLEAEIDKMNNLAWQVPASQRHAVFYCKL